DTTRVSAPSLRASCSARASSWRASDSLNRLATIPSRMALAGALGAVEGAGDFEAEAPPARHLSRRPPQPPAADAEVTQDLGADAVDAQIDRAPGRRTQLAEARLQRFGALRAVEEHHRALARFADRRERFAHAPGVRSGTGVQQVDDRERLVHAD